MASLVWHVLVVAVAKGLDLLAGHVVHCTQLYRFQGEQVCRTEDVLKESLDSRRHPTFLQLPRVELR